MRALPPSTTGQPRECANMVNSSPNAPDRGASNGSMEWAAAPAMIARASTVRKWVASRSADARPLSPNSAVAIGLLGIVRKGARKFGRMSSAFRTNEENIPCVGSAIHTQVGRGLVDGAGDRSRVTSVERLHEGEPRRQEVHASTGEISAAEERGGAEERVDRRADIVMEPGQRQFLGPAPSSDSVGPFDHVDGQSGAGHRQRGGEPVRSRAHDDGIGASHRDLTAQAPACRRPR